MARTASDDGDQRTRIAAPEAMRSAARQLGELLGSEPSAVSALRATDAGWSADVEVVEVERIPDTTSILATYQVSLDPEGNLLGYERTRRYARGQLDR